MFRSMPATSGCFSRSRTVRVMCGMSSPMSCAHTGRPVAFSVIEARMCFSRRELSWTRKNSVTNQSGAPQPAMMPMKPSPVTSCIGARTVAGAPGGIGVCGKTDMRAERGRGIGKRRKAKCKMRKWAGFAVRHRRFSRKPPACSGHREATFAPRLLHFAFRREAPVSASAAR